MGSGASGTPGALATVAGVEEPPLFAFDAVRLVDDGTVVLSDITFTVPFQGITVLVGPSGSGKSTVLRLCNRLAVPTAGTVRFHGEDLATTDPLTLRRRVGMVFQRPTLFDGDVLTNLRVARPGLAPADAGAALRRVGLGPEVLERDRTQLSGGEAQRVCLARTMVTGPEVLLMDEPTSALDPDNVHLLEHLVRTLAESGTPVLWVTHDRGQVRRIADTVVRVDGGRVVSVEATEPGGHVHDDDGDWR